MNKKLLPSELAELLSARKGTTRKSNEAFVRGFFELIEEALQNESFVKIKGFGTFKLVNVSERESVKINTGERFQISGHSKVTFTPDNTLKELVNKPFSHFETVILPDSTTNEELEAIDAEYEVDYADIPPQQEQLECDSNDPQPIPSQEDAMGDAKAEAATPPQAEISIQSIEQEQLTQEQKPAPQPQTIEENELAPPHLDYRVEDGLNQEHEHEVTTSLQHEEPHETALPENYLDNKDSDQSTNTQIQEPMQTSNHNITKTIVYVLATLLLMAMSYVAGYYHVIPMGDCPNSTIKEQSIVTNTDVQKHDSLSTDTLKLAPTETRPSIEQLRASLPDTLSVVRGLPEEQINRLKEGFPQVAVGSFYIIGTYKIHKLQEGETLLRLARKTYGHKDYVKYIILYNNFEDPNTISKDTEIKLPWLVEKHLVD